MYEIPLFPLNTVLFPGMPLRLHIFEERYKAMMKRVMAGNQTFGVNLIRSGKEALGLLPQPHTVGCTARVVQIDPLEGGRMNLTVVGDERYTIVKVSDNQPYLTGFVEALPLETPLSLEVVRGSHVLRRRLVKYLGLLGRYAREQEAVDSSMNSEFKLELSELQLPNDPLLLVYFASALLQIPASEKQPLLEAATAAQLLAMVLRIFRRELAVLPGVMDIQEEKARISARMN